MAGNLWPKSHWQETSAVVGPFAFVWIRQYANVSALHFHNGSPPVAKVLALVKQGQQITVAVPDSERETVALLYRPGAPLGLRGGEPLVTFQACNYGNTSWAQATEFNGGIYVAKPMCLSLLVSVNGGQLEPIDVPIGLGRRTCT